VLCEGEAVAGQGFVHDATRVHLCDMAGVVVVSVQRVVQP